MLTLLYRFYVDSVDRVVTDDRRHYINETDRLHENITLLNLYMKLSDLQDKGLNKNMDCFKIMV